MKIKELTDHLVRELTALDHDEFVSVADVSKGPGSESEPYNHVLVTVEHANGARSAIQVMQVTGPGIAPAGEYRIPANGW
ncbi:hypothetical protein [Actinokineospora enzanensis]|uniref:hypothetical protein n=1 Tax=Actinokineospora enzanensis TaxID=155975 RepID=UPI00035CBE24|nr:hypothetical protein [Actinokineospora enzanensis]